jgi:hypothetical protein
MDMSNFEEIAKAKAKIAKLMNMTVENGCSEDEQETAMAMAAGIATRLGIELSTVTAAGAEPTRRKASRKVFNQVARYEQQRLERERREQERRNALTVAEREAEDKELERERKKAERAAARRKGPREKSIPWGVGSSAGLAAGDRVKLRREIG